MSVIDRARSTGRGSRFRASIDLDEPDALQPVVAGAKAASLAKARSGGLPTAPGFVIPTDAVARLGREGRELFEHLRPDWAALSRDGADDLIVRSSSTSEDQEAASMAGQFETVADVGTWSAFVTAVEAVADSGRGPAGGHPMAILVQPMIETRLAGVLFGIDPVSGREDHLVVATIAGNPGDLVAGEASGSRYVLERSGRRVSVDPRGGGGRLRRRHRRELALLAARTAELFGGPQDVEWAFDARGQLRLLQSRPVTTERRGIPEGPLFGPGPVAETFPDALSRLEEDLWVPPLRQAVREALVIGGSASRRRLRSSPVVVSVGGHVAVDLELVGEAPVRHPGWSRIDPRPSFRRLLASWRVGRLRAALPNIACDLLERADRQLVDVPPLTSLTESQLLGLLDRASEALVSLHGHEVLLGSIADPGAKPLTGTAAALDVVVDGRRRGLPDDEIVRRSPVALALLPPRVGPPVTVLPDVTGRRPRTVAGEGRTDAAALREALRLRVRWMQELTARAAWELGLRLTARGDLPGPEHVRALALEELLAVTAGGRSRLDVRVPEVATRVGPLPAMFRISDRGQPVPIADPNGGAATGAGGGSATGVVHHDPESAPPGSVLVVRALSPQLAPVLERLAGVISETGSVLSHAAILAREAGVATVVGASGALDRYPPGTTVSLDGTTGAITITEAVR